MEATDLNEVLDTLVGLGRTITTLEKEKEVPEAYELGGVPYVTRDVKPLMKPVAAAIEVSTLTGLVDYLAANVDGLTMRDLVAHVKSPTYVVVFSRLFGDHQQRQFFIQANAKHVPTIKLDEFIPADDFNLMLMSCFTDDEERKKVLAVTGNITVASEVKTLDDGVSQEASIKAGIRRMEDVDVPNPVILTPFRTFTDVPQPSGKFVFRMRANDKGIQCALFDATGGAWKGEAMDNIKNYLQKELAACAPTPIDETTAPNTTLDISIIA